MTKLFGTDGVRGVAGTPPLDPETVARLGAALVRVLPHRGAGRILVGRDTRESGDWIEQALARGVASQGAQLVSTGVVPTPAVAYLTGSRDFDAGLVISASHNPFQDNGIKVFSGHGREVRRGARARHRGAGRRSRLHVDPAARPRSRARIWSTPTSLMRARRCPRPARSPGRASASTAPTARRRRWRRGCSASWASTSWRSASSPTAATSTWSADRRIPSARRRSSRTRSCRFGIAFDGDGDRAILIDAGGRSWTATPCCYLCAKHMQRRRTPEGQRHRRHRDEQHRPRDRAARRRHRACCAARSATST